MTIQIYQCSRELSWYYLEKQFRFHALLKSEARLARAICKAVVVRMTPALYGLPFRKLDVVCDGGMRWEAAAAGAVFSQLCIWQLWLDSVQRLKRYCHLELLTWSIFYRVRYLFTKWDRMDRNALITKKYDKPLQGSHRARFQLPACFQHWLPHCTVTCLVHLNLV